MGFFPKIQSPCPYKGSLSDIMDGDVCRLCKKQVVDITEMGDDGRRAFLQNCEGEVCVSYRILRPALAAAAAASIAALAAPAYACDTDVPPAAAAPADQTIGMSDIIVGGMRAPHKAEWVEHRDVARVPNLPVVYEDEATAGRDIAAVKASGGA